MRKSMLVAGGAILIAIVAGRAQQQEVEKLAPFYPTPEAVVQKMLELGELKKGEWHYDLGSGDGRVVIMAAQKFGAHSVGFEIDDSLYQRSMAKIKDLGLEKLATIRKQDLMTADFSKPDLITVYLLPTSNDKIQPLLEKSMHKGSRVVSHDFEFRGWKAEKTINIEDDDQGDIRTHTLYLYRR
ncbi:MAG TPA: SAM-dependent methyltransferase [Bryobacterales bacterium]|jgi:protein-L-isoaspartate O-methyltransferase|nr:SAM-dependent methyltransferase [Bryobacterales bacterium]